jgi:hypothetical protein
MEEKAQQQQKQEEDDQRTSFPLNCRSKMETQTRLIVIFSSQNLLHLLTCCCLLDTPEQMPLRACIGHSPYRWHNAPAEETEAATAVHTSLRKRFESHTTDGQTDVHSLRLRRRSKYLQAFV